MDKKIMRTLCCILTAVVLILLSTVLIIVQEASATSTKPSSGFGWKYAYDKQGRIASITDPANKKTRFRYLQNKKGGLNGMTKELPGGSKVKFKFDKYGRRTEMVDSAGTVRYVYDRLGRLKKVHREGTPSITYGYDTLDRIKSIKIGTGFKLQYAYDFRGRPKKISTPEGNILFSYNTKTGEVTRRLPNRISTKWTSRPDGRLDSITHTSSDKRSLAKYHYNYRLDGLITSVKELTSSGVQTRRYKYDTAQRLVLTSGADQQKIEFAYDKSGNRTKLHRQGSNPISAQYDWAGRLTRYDGKLIQHDSAGNLTSCFGSSKSFTFDDTGLLKTATLKNGKIIYRYDGDGYLISRSNGASKQKFLPDPLSDIWQPLAVKGSKGKQTFYIWVGSAPLMAITGKQVRYFLHDHLGSVRIVTDRGGEIIERFDYTPFGLSDGKIAHTDLNPGFAGLFFDDAASVYLTRARTYDPELGRFLQSDPEHRVPGGLQEDLSGYAYCGGDPINYVDLGGTSRVPVGDRILNWVGRNSVWIGRNRSGGIESYKKDSYGQFPLGDTRLAGNSTIDKYARLHDIEYWVSTHFPKGTQVKVPAPGGKYEYFTSEGDSGLTRVNLRVMGKGLVAPHRFTPWSNKFSQGRKTLRSNKLVEYELKYDKRQKSMTIFPYKDKRFPHNDTSSLRNHFTDKSWSAVSTLASKYPSAAVGAADRLFGIASHISGVHEVINANRANPADLATTARNVSYTLATIGTIFPQANVASGAASLINTGIAVGQTIRSQTIQNRTIGLIRLPTGYRGPITGTQQLRSHWGSFNIKGSNFASRGGWSLQHQWKRNRRFSSSNAWAMTNLNKYRLNSGALMSGNIRTAERRLESTNSQWRQRTTSFSGRVTFNGASFGSSGSWGGPSGGFSGFESGKVGGIRLTGAGKALSYLGGLEGIALDQTNDRLVLIGKGKRPINLPPLRLDDVVTIFRSVYLHGEAPTVSIDPISKKKTEKWMNVRHGAATANTYVGWVLYEADRIMKTYQFGKDNRTKARLYSQIPGYRNLYKRSKGPRKTVWSRFWIVPASLNRTQGSTSELTIFDVPLKVETERMEWSGGKLVTARNPTPSYSSKQFQEWFTRNYDLIAKEYRLQPPAGCGVKGRVAVFQELRRMALITAIAETLRDQNVPFPAWMRDYPVRSCKIDKKTPFLRDVERGKFLMSGGVQLAASDENVHLKKGDKKVTRLARVTQAKVATKPLFSSVSFNQDGKTYSAVTLPGADTKRSGSNILRHTDLTAPILQETGIKITRHFNSFYDPSGIFGRGWTLDLPRLEQHRKPSKRTDNSISYQPVYQLSSPLNTWSERFAEVKNVTEVNRQLMVPTTSGEMLGLTDLNFRIIKQKTRELIFRDGSSWHFDTDGYLVARSDKKTMIIYQRDEDHRINSIKAWTIQGNSVSSGKPDAEIILAYDDKSNQVRSIEARSPKLEKPSKATYIYDESDQLLMVIGSDGKRKYTYRDGLVTSITDKNNNRVAFEYNKQGQLQTEKRADGKKVAYKRTSTSYGSKVVAMDTNSRKAVETVEYDANFHQIGRSRTFDDGSKFAWRQHDKEVETTITDTYGEGYTVTDSNDGLHSTMKTTAGETYITDYDTDGRVTKAKLEGGPTLEQKWHSDGRLKVAVSDEQGVRPSYTGDRKLSSVTITPRDQVQAKHPAEYVKTNYDAKGRLASITDDSGSKLEIRYDKSGQPSEISSQHGTVTIDRDTKGHVREVGTTWGLVEKYDYEEKSGNLSRITLQQQHAGTTAEQATIELSDGLVSKIHQPDGGETTLNYYKDEKQKGLLKEVRTTEKLKLAYSYDKSSRLTGIDIGGGDDSAYRVSYNYDKKGRLSGLSYKPIPGR